MKKGSSQYRNPEKPASKKKCSLSSKNAWTIFQKTKTHNTDILRGN